MVKKQKYYCLMAKILKNCWEFIKCSKDIKENCDVYKTESGKECWLLVDVDKGGPAAKCSCFNCEWYKKFN